MYLLGSAMLTHTGDVDISLILLHLLLDFM